MRPAVHGGRVRGDHVEAVQGQAAGHRGEQAAPVGGGHRHPVAVEVHGRQRPGRPARGRAPAASGSTPVSSAVCTRRTSSAISRPFQSDQAAGPVARGVGAGQRVQQVEGGGVADRLGDRGDGHRVAQVAAGGHLGQQQVQPDQLLDQRDVRGRQPDPGGDRGGDRRADDAVVAGQALADVVQEARRSAAGRAGPPRGRSRSASCGRLHQVPVEGEPVDRVVLRAGCASGPTPAASASTRPYRSQVSQVGTSAGAGAEQGDQRGPGGRRPGRGQRRAERGQPLAGGPGDRQPGGGGRGGHPQRQARIRAGADRGAGEHQLAVLFDHVAGDRAARRAAGGAAPARPTRSRSAARQASSRACATVRASPATRRSSASPSSQVEQRRRRRRAPGRRSRSTRRPTARCSASRVSSRRRCGGAHGGRAWRRRPRRRRSPRSMPHVPQAAGGLLEVALQQERQLAVRLPAGGGELPQRGQWRGPRCAATGRRRRRSARRRAPRRRRRAGRRAGRARP